MRKSVEQCRSFTERLKLVQSQLELQLLSDNKVFVKCGMKSDLETLILSEVSFSDIKSLNLSRKSPFICSDSCF